MEQMISAYEEQKQSRPLMMKEVREAVRDSAEQMALENGNLTHENMNNLLLLQQFTAMEDRLSEKYRKMMNDGFTQMKELLGVADRTEGVAANINGNNNGNNLIVEFSEYKTYCHGDSTKVYFVPEGYELIKQTSLINAFRLFVNGDCANKRNINGELTNQPVRPFYFWTSKTIPATLWSKYKSGWQRILKLMMKCDDLAELITKMDQNRIISNEEIDDYYNKGLAYVHSQVEYIKLNNMNWERWSITTWNKNINNNKIKEKGTDEDKRRLGPDTHYNKKHATKRRRTR